VRSFIEIIAARHILARGAQRGGGNKKNQDESANAPARGGRNRALVRQRRRDVLIERGHHVILGITS